MDQFQFEEKIKYYIKRDGRSQAAVARALGYNRDQFNKWVRGVNRIPDTALQEVATLLKLTDDEAIELFELAGYVVPARSEKVEIVASDDDSPQVIQLGLDEDVNSPLHKTIRNVTWIIARLMLYSVVGVLCVAILFGWYVNFTRNYPTGLLATDTCLPPPPNVMACPSPQVDQTLSFPLPVEQCQEIQDGFFMHTKAILTEDGNLKATTVMLSDKYVQGFTGRATVYFCHNNEEIYEISNRWGVNGRAIYGAASKRTIDWDCPKGEVNQECYETFSPLNVVDQEVVDQVTHLNIVHTRDEGQSDKRLEKILLGFRELMAVFE